MLNKEYAIENVKPGMEVLFIGVSHKVVKAIVKTVSEYGTITAVSEDGGGYTRDWTEYELYDIHEKIINEGEEDRYLVFRDIYEKDLTIAEIYWRKQYLMACYGYEEYADKYYELKNNQK